MNSTIERLALRVRSWLMARRTPNETSLTDRLSGWAQTGSGWRWLAAGPALVVVLAGTVVWWVASQVAGFGGILAGWSPPLTLAALDSTPPCREPLPASPPGPDLTSGEDDAAAWNFNHDPWVRLQQEQLAVQREHLAELRLQREARAAELATTRRTGTQPQQPAAAAPVPSSWWPHTPPPRRRPHPRRVGHALVVIALVAGLAWGIGAFSLGIASSAGWIRQLPTFTQLQTPQGTTP